MVFKDVRKKQIKLGDLVAYVTQGTSSGWMDTGYVVGFTPKMVRIGDRTGKFECNRHPEKIAILESEAVIFTPTTQSI